MTRSLSRLVLGAVMVAATLPTPSPLPAAKAPAASTVAPDRLLATLHRAAPNLDREVLRLALHAAAEARRAGKADRDDVLTVIDYSRPSTEPRLWVFDLEHETLLWEELVAHGKNTGGNLARRFSNVNESKQSSLGLFRTAATYVGKNGYSLRLDGLEPGVNDLARRRAIVIHGAPYVSQEFVRQQGRLGRSWGCPAVSTAVARPLIDRIAGGSLVFAYYPERSWLAASRFLKDADTGVILASAGAAGGDGATVRSAQ